MSSIPGETVEAAANALRGVSLDTDGRLADHLICLGCGYDLWGAKLAADCPECGRPVEQSLKTDQLHFADPPWLKQVLLGMDLCLIGTGGAFVLLIALWLTLAIAGIDDRSPAFPVVCWLFGMPPGLCMCYGAWKLTTPEPGVTGKRNTARAIARWAAVATTLLAGLSLPVFVAFYIFAGSGSGGPVLPGVTQAFFVTLAGGPSAAVFGFAALAYAVPLARRAGSRAVVILTRVIFIFCVAQTAAPFVGIALMALGVAVEKTTSMKGLGVILIVVVILGFITWLLLIPVVALLVLALAISFRVMMAGVVRRARML